MFPERSGNVTGTGEERLRSRSDLTLSAALIWSPLCSIHSWSTRTPSEPRSASPQDSRAATTSSPRSAGSPSAWATSHGSQPARQPSGACSRTADQRATRAPIPVRTSGHPMAALRRRNFRCRPSATSTRIHTRTPNEKESRPRAGVVSRAINAPRLQRPELRFASLIARAHPSASSVQVEQETARGFRAPARLGTRVRFPFRPPCRCALPC